MRQNDASRPHEVVVVTRDEFAAASENAPIVDPERFHADLDAALDEGCTTRMTAEVHGLLDATTT